jgi:hypothetical protein
MKKLLSATTATLIAVTVTLAGLSLRQRYIALDEV